MNHGLKIIAFIGAMLLASTAQAEASERSNDWLGVVREQVVEPFKAAWRKTDASMQRFLFTDEVEGRARLVIEGEENRKVFDEADADFVAGRFEEAEQKVVILLDQYPNEAAFYLLRSIVQGTQGDVEGAFGTVRQALDKDHDYAVARIWQAQLYLAKGDLTRARELSTSAGKKYGLIPVAMLIEALAKWEEKQYKKAINDLEQLLVLHPDQVGVYEYLAVMYRDQGRLQKAYGAIDAFIKGQPGELRDAANGFRIGLLLDMGRTKGARAVYDQVFGAEPDGWYGLIAGLEIAYADNNYERAVTVAETLAKRFPDIDGIEAIQFRAYLANKDYAGASEIVDRIEQELPASGAAFSFRGDLLLAQEHYVDAIAQYRNAIKAEPDNQTYYKSLGWTLSALGRPAEVLLIYEQALERFPDNYFLHSQSGRMYRELGRNQDAIKAYQNAIAIAPGKFNAHTGLGTTYRNMEDFESAEKHYKHAIELLPAYDEAYWLLADVHLRQAQYERAIPLAREAIRLAPEKGQAYGILAKVYHRQGRTDKARKVCDSMADKVDLNAEGRYNIGLCYYSTEATELAVSEFDASVRIAPTYSSHMALAGIHHNKGRGAEAIAQYRKALEINPDGFEAHFKLARLYHDRSDLVSALKEANETLRIKPGKREVHQLLAVMYIKLGRKKEALEHSLKAIEIEPSQAELYELLGSVYHAMGRYDKGIKALKKGLDLDPTRPDMFNELGRIYLVSQQYQQAITAFQKALELGRSDAALHTQLGTAYHNSGQPKLALDHLKKALIQAPDSFDAHYQVALVYGQTGALEQALAEFRVALVIRPKEAVTHNNIGYIYFLKKDFDTAISWYQKSLRLDPDSGLAHYNLSLARYAKGEYALATTNWKQAKTLGYRGSPQYEETLQRVMASNTPTLIRERP